MKAAKPIKIAIPSSIRIRNIFAIPDNENHRPKLHPSINTIRLCQAGPMWTEVWEWIVARDNRVTTEASLVMLAVLLSAAATAMLRVVMEAL